jgi:hypothetical protein
MEPTVQIFRDRAELRVPDCPEPQLDPQDPVLLERARVVLPWG